MAIKKFKVETLLAAREFDLVYVNNYRRKKDPVELGIVADVRTSWSYHSDRQKYVARNIYNVVLLRVPSKGFGRLDVTVGDDGIIEAITNPSKVQELVDLMTPEAREIYDRHMEYEVNQNEALNND